MPIIAVEENGYAIGKGAIHFPCGIYFGAREIKGMLYISHIDDVVWALDVSSPKETIKDIQVISIK